MVCKQLIIPPTFSQSPACYFNQGKPTVKANEKLLNPQLLLRNIFYSYSIGPSPINYYYCLSACFIELSWLIFIPICGEMRCLTRPHCRVEAIQTYRIKCKNNLLKDAVYLLLAATFSIVNFPVYVHFFQPLV